MKIKLIMNNYQNIMFYSKIVQISPSFGRYVNLGQTWHGPQGPEKLKRPRIFTLKEVAA